MEDDECSLIFVKVTNPYIINVAAKSSCIIHPPKYHRLGAKNSVLNKEANLIKDDLGVQE